MPTSIRSRTALLVGVGTALVLCLLVATGRSPALPASPGPLSGGSVENADDAGLITADSAAMTTMMSKMAVKPSGDADYDFASAMIPHHQGAIDMAMAELKYGKNEQLRRIAQEIIVDQLQEIAAMRLAIGCSGEQAAAPASDMKMNR